MIFASYQPDMIPLDYWPAALVLSAVLWSAFAVVRHKESQCRHGQDDMRSASPSSHSPSTARPATSAESPEPRPQIMSCLDTTADQTAFTTCDPRTAGATAAGRISRSSNGRPHMRRGCFEAVRNRKTTGHFSNETPQDTPRQHVFFLSSQTKRASSTTLETWVTRAYESRQK